jgi:hypothetical protein
MQEEHAHSKVFSQSSQLSNVCKLRLYKYDTTCKYLSTSIQVPKMFRHPRVYLQRACTCRPCRMEQSSVRLCVKTMSCLLVYTDHSMSCVLVYRVHINAFPTNSSHFKDVVSHFKDVVLQNPLSKSVVKIRYQTQWSKSDVEVFCHREYSKFRVVF